MDNQIKEMTILRNELRNHKLGEFNIYLMMNLMLCRNETNIDKFLQRLLKEEDERMSEQVKDNDFYTLHWNKEYLVL